MTPHDIHVLGGDRAIDEAADRLPEPVESPQWSARSVLASIGAVAFIAGVVTINVLRSLS